MDNQLYHVLLEGRRVGPYDRRTIVGMRVKKALTSKSLLVGADGVQLTVAELLNGKPPEPKFEPSRSGSYSVIQATHPAKLVEIEGSGYEIPPFKGDIEVRVQTKVLRLAGRFREGVAWKEDRVKFPLQDIAHARLRGTVVDLWVRAPSQSALQRIALDLGTRDAAGELAEALPQAAPWPGSEPLAARPRVPATALHPMLWAVVVGTTLVVGGLLVWVLTRPA